MLHSLASAPRRGSPPPEAPSEERGRTALGSPDPAGLDDTTLLAALLRGRVGRPAEVAEALLDRFGALGDVFWANRTDLARLDLAGGDLVVDLAVLRELAVRFARAAVSARPVLGSSSALQAYARAAMAHRPREQFRVLFLDHRNRLLADEMTAEGTVDHAPVYPREVMRRALEVSASALILIHNHPSGDPSPSQADIEMTRRVIDAARALGLSVHDHLVVGREGTASFRALGLM
ncbi:MAG: DNA repair protein RadC [Brevundimonas sp.]|nr:DNA repair protein RadC [Brevundimonas sp.]